MSWKSCYTFQSFINNQDAPMHRWYMIYWLTSRPVLQLHRIIHLKWLQKALLERSMARTTSSLYSQQSISGSEAVTNLPLQSRRSSYSGNMFSCGASLRRRRMPNVKQSAQSAAVAPSGINNSFLPMSSLDFPTPSATTTTALEPRSSPVPIPFSQQVNELCACSAPDSFICNVSVTSNLLPSQYQWLHINIGHIWQNNLDETRRLQLPSFLEGSAIEKACILLKFLKGRSIKSKTRAHIKEVWAENISTLYKW